MVKASLLKAAYRIVLLIALSLMLLIGVMFTNKLMIPALTSRGFVCSPGFHTAPTALLQPMELLYATQPQSVVLNDVTGVLYALTDDGLLHIWQNGVETTCQEPLPSGPLILNPTKNELYLSALTETLVLSGATGDIIHRIPLSGMAAVSAANNRILILTGHDVVLIDADTYQTVGTVPGIYEDRPDAQYYTDHVYGDEVTDRYPRSIVSLPNSEAYWIVENKTAIGHGGGWGEAFLEAVDPVTYATTWSGELNKSEHIAFNSQTGAIYYMNPGGGDDPVPSLHVYDSHYNELESILHNIGSLVFDPQAQRLYVLAGRVTVINAPSFEMIDRFAYAPIIAAAQGYLLLHTSTSLRLVRAETLAEEQRPQIQPVETLPLFNQVRVIDGTLFLSAQDGVYRTSDNGTVWERVMGCAYPTRLTVAPTQALFVTCLSTNPHLGEGVFRSDDRGQTWSSINRGLTAMNYSDLTLSETYSDDQTLWVKERMRFEDPWMVSHDAGDHWQPGEPPATRPSQEVHLMSCAGSEIVADILSQNSFDVELSLPTVSDETSWIVSRDQRLYHYESGRECWIEIPQFSNLAHDYRTNDMDPGLSLAVLTSQEAYVVTHEVHAGVRSTPTQLVSVLYQTIDGGVTWHELLRTTWECSSRECKFVS